MKLLASSLAKRIHRLDSHLQMVVEALSPKGEDLKATKAEWDTGTQSPASSLKTYDDGSVTLTPTPTATASHTSSDGFVTDLDQSVMNGLDVLAWELADSIGTDPKLNKVEVYLTRKRDGGQPTYDGDFLVSIFRLDKARRPLEGLTPLTFDIWQLARVVDPIRVRASEMTSDTELVPFLLDGLGQRPMPLAITGRFVPDNRAEINVPSHSLPGLTAPQLAMKGRVIVVVVQAVGGTNTNYGLGRDSGVSTDKSSSGTLRHRILTGDLKYDNWLKLGNTATGMTRATLSLGSYAATGSLQFTGGAKLTLPAAVAGEVEFVMSAQVPAGTSLIMSARVGGGDAWVPVKSGQKPTDVGLAVSQFYEMKWDFTANGAADTSPVLRTGGIIDRTLVTLNDLDTDLVRLEGFTESVDVFSGEVKMAEGHIIIQKVGVRDYRDLATQLMSNNDFTSIYVRIFAAARGTAREDYLHLSTYRVDDYEDNGTELDLLCVSILERLKGNFPLPGGQLFGYVLKGTNSDLTGGADFNKQLAEGTEAATTLVVSIAASATEAQYGFTLPGVPNLPRWPSGDFIIKLEVDTGDSDVFGKVRVSRVNASGTVQQSTAYTDEQQLTTGTKVFNIRNVSWNVGASTHRLRVEYSFRNNVGSSQSVTIKFGTLNSEVITPWTQLTVETPKVYTNADLQFVYNDWLVSQVGVGEEFRGALPGNTSDLLTKTVMQADGKRELERIAFLDGGCPIASQGKIKYVTYMRPSGMGLAFFPLEEQTGHKVSLGLRARVPDLFCGFGFDNGQRPGDFAGKAEVRHAAALSKFGVSRIDNPEREVEPETARYIPNVDLALRVITPMVQALGTGLLTISFNSLIPHPELEVGDPVEVETDQIVFKHPVSDQPFRGLMWAFGVIIEKGNEYGTAWKVWIRDYANLWGITQSLYRRSPGEFPWVTAQVISIPDQPQNAQVRLRAYPEAAVIKYYVHEDGTAPVDRDSPLWLTYSTVVTIARDAANDRLFSFFAKHNGFYGQLVTVRIPPDQSPVIQQMTVTQSGTSPNVTVKFTASAMSPGVREIIWLARTHATNWPTSDGTQNGPITQTEVDNYFIARTGVSSGGISIGRSATGTPKLGVPFIDITGRSTGDVVRVIAFVVDHTGLVRETSRFATAYTVTGTPSVTIQTVSYAVDEDGTSCSDLREYNFTHNNGDANLTDAFTIKYYARLNSGDWRQIGQNDSPKSTSTTNNCPVDAFEGGFPTIDMTCDLKFELYDGGAVLIESGTIGSQDFWEGDECPA